MPSWEYDNGDAQRAKMKRIRAKLIAKGLDPRSNKFLVLLHREMR